MAGSLRHGPVQESLACKEKRPGAALAATGWHGWFGTHNAATEFTVVAAQSTKAYGSKRPPPARVQTTSMVSPCGMTFRFLDGGERKVCATNVTLAGTAWKPAAQRDIAI